ncbi:MAG: alpha-1,4-glucan--maltose-1-phosphate maltosyltransferase [Polyangiales bacterium]
MSRVIVEGVTPALDAGPYAVKRVLGDELRVEADLVCDGHDVVTGRVLYRPRGDGQWREVRLAPLVNDRFVAQLTLDALGAWEFVVEGCVDTFATWRRAYERKQQGSAEVDVIAHLRQGATVLRPIAARAADPDRALLQAAVERLDDAERRPQPARDTGSDEVVAALASRYPGFESAGRSRLHELVVEPRLARFSSWYEFFPRSTGARGEHGNLRSSIARLEYAAGLGFDVVYLPPIHPIGQTFRKGPNNSPKAGSNDPGSPWAIGAAEGGHKSIHPQLGTLDDFRAFVQRARELGVEIALDIALQASPDHPYVKEHPEWFAKRPDGTIQYAENPPKKYQDIYPFDFECEAAPALWDELTSIFLHWAELGIKVFRVDNPHTKSLPFWGYCIAQLKQRYPETILLAEAFTRPKLMYALAKLGFSQSYTYFTWRNSKYELTQYMTELTKTEAAEFFRPNFWPNTPDILPEHLQYGGRGAFISRLVLAATLSSNYGIYGPAYELMDHVARPGAEEYVDNEKYELKHWPVEREDSLQHLIKRINEVRRANVALQSNSGLEFHATDNDTLLCYSKRSGTNVVLVVVNLDHHHRQAGWLQLDLAKLGLPEGGSFQVHDQLSDARYLWSGPRNFVDLDPSGTPAHVFVLRHRVRSEAEFDYFA